MPPCLPLCLLKAPLITGQSPSRHALGKTGVRARRVVEKMWRGRDPGDVPAGHLSPISKEHLVWSQLAFSERNKCVFVNGTFAAMVFMLSRRREIYSRIEKKWKWIYIFFPPKETKSISTAILSDAADFMLQRIENEYLAASTKSVCGDWQIKHSGR